MTATLRKLSQQTELVLVTTLCLAYLIGGSLYLALSGIRQADLSAGRALRGIAVELLTLAIAAAILRARDWDLGRLGLQFSWKLALAGIPLVLLYGIVYSVTTMLVRLAWPAAESWTFRFNMTAPLWLIVLFVIIHALFEQTIVTAYVITALSSHGAAVAIAASALLHLAIHLYLGPLTAIGILPLDVLFGVVFWKTRNAWPLIVAHTMTNLLALAGPPKGHTVATTYEYFRGTIGECWLAFSALLF